MVCLVCKSELGFRKDFDAKDYGYDCDGIVETYHCLNNECNLFYEKINFVKPKDDSSEDFYRYGQEYIKFYSIDN